MDSSDAFSQHTVGDEASQRPRRMSMEEDLFYRELMTSRPANPPSYETAMKSAMAAQRRALATAQQGSQPVAPPEDVLPKYSCDVHAEGVFMRKMEIEHTIKRAEVRNWQMVYVELRGTALNIYSVKKERTWFSPRHDGPDISPDSPPWVKKASLEKSYCLQHADAGIAADYRKRRYVIRLRAETDQFLLSCVELKTFVKWLDCIFAAINVAAPIDERDFPRDQSIPRLQRLRWLRGERPTPEDNISGFQRLNERRQSIASSRSGEEDEENDRNGRNSTARPPTIHEEENERGNQGQDDYAAFGRGGIGQHPIVGRLSTTSYPNENVDPDTGKWRPRQIWTETHDHLYAKLCYSVLLFKSPRKSNYIISNGKRWYVDWATGRMVRVLPPAYGEVELFGPWQIIRAENRLL
ncbi:hypothetical protein B0H65DRAFT_278041 [Neurospora tetraspora]|uniref:PH domain-containing protein n=1 Tax=Neurospora tetraspora TaxID=94610 RepID=A0AAE0MQ91_9PEZI|nr:hypothetical protein B0H65DRAFT_278041 [Neurospora tetraspora]